MFGYYVAGGISKAHINPAVTLVMALRRGFPWAKVPVYMLVQVAGGFVAAALIYANHKSAITGFEHSQHIVRGQPTSVKSFSIFATFPAKYFTSWVGPFVDQVIGTARGAEPDPDMVEAARGAEEKSSAAHGDS